jgi:cell division protein FtsQ
MSIGLRLLATILPLGIIVGGILGFLDVVKQPGRFPLRFIEIQNELKWMPPEAISQVVSPYLQQGFFGIDVEAIQKQVNDLPWVSKSHVQRVWPDRISIALTEQNPLARFGETGVLSTEGKIFYPEILSVLPPGCPWFKGPEKAAMEMLKQYLDFLEMLSPLGLSISELSLSNEGAYRIMLDNGIAIILGKAALNERMGRFILMYPSQLKKETQRIAYLDLRYTNGMAIGWKAVINKAVINNTNYGGHQ